MPQSTHRGLEGYCAARAGRVTQAFDLFQEMRKRAVQPSHVTYITLLNACAVIDPPRVDRALEVLCLAASLCKAFALMSVMYDRLGL